MYCLAKKKTKKKTCLFGFKYTILTGTLLYSWHVICLATVFLILIDGVWLYSFNKQHYGCAHHGHIPGQRCLDSSGSNCLIMTWEG